MRYAQIRSMDVSSGSGIGVSLFSQGCPYYCQGCHNMSTWSANGGREFTDKEQEKVLSLLRPEWVSRLSILGGEPLLPQNVRQLSNLIAAAQNKKPSLKVWLWTGTTLEDLIRLCFKQEPNDSALSSLGWTDDNLNDLYDILSSIDYLIDGRFVQEKRDITLPWRGSTNQRVIDVQESKKHGWEPILVPDE